MSVIVLVHLTGNGRMRRVKRIEALYFLSFPSFAFLFCLKLTLLFAHSHFLLSFFSLGGRITTDDVEVAAIAFFILDRSTKKKIIQVFFFPVYSVRCLGTYRSRFVKTRRTSYLLVFFIRILIFFLFPFVFAK